MLTNYTDKILVAGGRGKTGFVPMSRLAIALFGPHRAAEKLEAVQCTKSVFRSTMNLITSFQSQRTSNI
jgi:hypothetical protein